MFAFAHTFVFSNVVQVELGESLIARTEALGPYPLIYSVIPLHPPFSQRLSVNSAHLIFVMSSKAPDAQASAM